MILSSHLASLILLTSFASAKFPPTFVITTPVMVIFADTLGNGLKLVDVSLERETYHEPGRQ